MLYPYCKYGMDANTLKELIKRVAVIKDRKPAQGVDTRIKRNMEWVTEIDPATGEEIEVERPIPVDNPTLGFDLVEIKHQSKPCELKCGQSIKNQVIERRFCEGPEPHWRTRCKNCGAYVHPSGVGFIEGAHSVAAEYIKWFNYLNGVAKSKGQMPKGQLINEIREKRTRWISEADGTIRLDESVNKQPEKASKE